MDEYFERQLNKFMRKHYTRIALALTAVLCLTLLSGCSHGAKSTDIGTGTGTGFTILGWSPFAPSAATKAAPDKPVRRPERVSKGTPDISKWLKISGFNKYQQGEWCDSNGKIVLTLAEKKVNNLPIVQLFRGPAMSSCYCARVQDGQQTKDIFIDFFPTMGEPSIHQYAVLDEKIILRRPGHWHDYFESVDGVYLNMTKDEVLAKWGEPTERVPSQTREQFEQMEKFYKSIDPNHHKLTYAPYERFWRYAQKGCRLEFNYLTGELEEIDILPGSTVHFDKSGLGYDSPRSAYKEKYHYTDGYEFYNVMVGPDEWIRFFKYPQEIIFSTLDNG